MPKVIRLTTTEPNGIWDNDFKDDIIIKPYSRIALQNIVVETDGDPYIVNQANDTINYQLTSSEGELTARIAHGEYSEVDGATGAGQASLLNEIGFAMNKAIAANAGKALGLQWQCVKSDKGKIEIGYMTAPVKGSDMGDWTLKNVDLDTSVTPNVFRRQGGTYTTDDAYMFNPNPFAKGGSQFRIQTSKLDVPGSGGATTQGVVIGLVQKDPTKFTTDPPTIDDIIVGIRATKYDATATGDYRFIVNGVESNSSDPIVSETSFICIEANKGVYNAGYYVNSADTFNLVGSAAMLNADTYMVMWFFGNGNVAQVNATTIRYTTDPYATPTSVLGVSSSSLGSLPQQFFQSTNGYLSLSSSLAQHLGFTTERHPSAGNVSQGRTFTYHGVKQFKPLNLSDSFVVQLLSLKIDSYDGLTGGRENVLAVIPESDNSARLLYTPPYPLFLDLNNNKPLSIRNFSARVLRNDFSEVETVGLSVLTVIITDK